MTDDLVKRLEVKAGMITLGDRIEWGSDAALMLEAKNRIEQMEAALNDMRQYFSRADWQYLNDETIKTLEGGRCLTL